MARKLYCLRCRYRPRFAKKLCRACYEYQRRTGKPRPLATIIRQWERAS